MKSQTLIAIFMCTSLFSAAQNTVYDANANKKTFTWEDMDLTFTNSAITFPAPPKEQQKEFAGLLLSLIPTAVDLAFKTTTKILENNLKKFSAEYTKQASNMDAGSGAVPDFHFVRQVKLGENAEKALDIGFKAVPVKQLNAFVYYVDNIALKYSSAKSNNASKVFDYSFEIKLTLKTKDEAKAVELAPIVVSSVGYGSNAFPSLKYRSDIISLPAGAVLTQVSIKIVETNPIKVRAEKIVGVWSDYKDEAKTIINNFLPASKKDSSSGDSGAGDKGASSDDKKN